MGSCDGSCVLISWLCADMKVLVQFDYLLIGSSRERLLGLDEVDSEDDEFLGRLQNFADGSELDDGGEGEDESLGSDSGTSEEELTEEQKRPIRELLQRVRAAGPQSPHPPPSLSAARQNEMREVLAEVDRRIAARRTMLQEEARLIAGEPEPEVEDEPSAAPRRGRGAARGNARARGRGTTQVEACLRLFLDTLHFRPPFV